MKKFLKPKWIIIAACVLVVAAAGTVFALNFDNWFGDSQETNTNEFDSNQLFWNLDGEDYAFKNEGRTSRPKDRDDGYYHVLFSSQGRQVKRRVKDAKVVNQIDSLDVMGLEFDNDGIVIGVKSLEDMGYTYATEYSFISNIDGNNITLNTGKNYNGIESKMTLSATTKMFDVSGTSGEAGIPIRELVQDDQVVALANKQGKVDFVYVISRFIVPDIYWNVERMWDDKQGISTRKPDEDGLYSFLLAVNGEQVTLKTKSVSVVKTIDSQPAKCVGLDIDPETGLITGAVYASTKTGGTTFCSWYDVMEWDGTNVTVRRNVKSDTVNYGKSVTGKVARGYKVFDVTGVDDFVGVKTELKLGDRVHVITNSRKEPMIFFVVGRTVDSKLYYNLKRSYDSKTKQTTLKPDANGYYVYTFAVDGKQETYRTKDIAIASKVDSYPGCTMGLKLEGDIIVKVYEPDSVCRGGCPASWYVVTKIDGKHLVMHKPDDSTASDAGRTVEADLADDYEMYVIDGAYVNFRGEATKNLYVGDVVQPWADINGNLKIVHIVTRNTMEMIPVKTAYCKDCGQTVTWNKWGGGSIPMSGHFILTADASNTQVNVSPKGYGIGKAPEADNQVSATIDLNGHSYTSYTRIFAVNNYSTLVLMDNAGGSVIKSTLDHGSDFGYGIWLKPNAECRFYDCTLDLSGVTTHGNGGCTVTVNNDAKFTMNSGHILCGTIDNSVDEKYNPKGKIGSGAGIHIGNKAVVNLNGGTISGGKVSGVDKDCNGGCIYMTGGPTLNLNGTVIENAVCYGVGASLCAADSRAVINMNSGAIRDGKCYTALTQKKGGGHGGNVFCMGTFNMYGGEISGGYAQACGGGNFSLNQPKSQLNMYGGTIKNGLTSASDKGVGANVYVWYQAGKDAFKMHGGLITDDEGLAVPAGQYSGGVTIAAKETVPIMSGSPKIIGNKWKEQNVNLFLNNKSVIELDGALEADAMVGINAMDTIKVVKNAKDYLANFKYDYDSYKLYVDSDNDIRVISASAKINKIYVNSAIKDASDKKYEKVFVGDGASLDDDIIFSAWDKSDSLPGSGNYYLTQDVVFNTNVDWQKYVSNNSLNLDLNGHTVTYSVSGPDFEYHKAGRAFVIGDKETAKKQVAVNICDSSEGQTGKIIRTDDAVTCNGGMVLVTTYGTFNLFSGTLDGSQIKSNQIGAVIQSTGTVNMFGGELVGGTTSISGGSICLTGSSAFNMYGGVMRNGVAKNGGNILSEESKINIYGGTVKDGVANGGNGGNIMYYGDGAQCNIYEATVSGGKGKIGGNILASRPLTINKGAQILDGKAVVNDGGGHGGNICAESTFDITGGVISGGSADNCGGGNISINGANAKITMTGGTIKNGYAKINSKENGANIYVWNNAGADAFKMFGGVITDDDDFTAPAGYYLGGVVIAGANSRATVGGSAQIIGNRYATGNSRNVNLFLKNRSMVKLDSSFPLTANAKISINAMDTIDVVENGKNYVSNFFYDLDYYGIGVNGNNLKVVVKSPAGHTHVYKSDCDATCDACGATRTDSAEHTYDNACDGDCNLCGAKRTAPHNVSVWKTDAAHHWGVCDTCGMELPKANHDFDGEFCKICDCQKQPD